MHGLRLRRRLHLLRLLLKRLLPNVLLPSCHALLLCRLLLLLLLLLGVSYPGHCSTHWTSVIT